MAMLLKNDDREDWLRGAIAFMQRGLWLDVEFAVHGPHDNSGKMWGDAGARVDGSEDNASVPCVFFAKARRSKYDPVNIRVYVEPEANQPVDKADRFPRIKISQLTPKARRWLRWAQRAAEKFRPEREKLVNRQKPRNPEEEITP